MKTLRDEIRARFPGLAVRANQQRLAAIKLHCVECMGGSIRDARSCETRECFLWPVAFNRGK